MNRANAACAFAYGSGLYGGSCYAGTIPKLLQLPPVQGNIQQDGFRFFLQGEPNRSYQIEYSLDLKTWEAIGTLVSPADGTAAEIRDSDPDPGARRFYRVIPL
jgi:hypothetical protein